MITKKFFLCVIVLGLTVCTSYPVYSEISSSDRVKSEIVKPDSQGRPEKTSLPEQHQLTNPITEDKFLILDADAKHPSDYRKLLEIDPLDKKPPPK